MTNIHDSGNHSEHMDHEHSDRHSTLGRTQVSRRSFLAGASVAAGLAALGLSGCGGTTSGSSTANSATASDTPVAGEPISGRFTDEGIFIPDFVGKAPEPIKDFAETHDFDVVVIGAGASGLPAALSAHEAGAKVAVIQREGTAISQGNTGSGIDLDRTSPEAVSALIDFLMKVNNYRAKEPLIRMWAENSGEAIKWVINHTKKAGAQIVDQGDAPQAIKEINGLPLYWVTSFFGPKPYDTGEGMKVLAKVAEDAGVTFFYSTRATQLIKDGDRVTGVVGQTKDKKNIRVNAAKAVILACGDYQNNKEMSDFYLPDVRYFERKQGNKKGDGHKMGVWAGGVIEPLNHTKMLHDFDAGPSTMCDFPFLSVNDKGERFCCETIPMSLYNNYLRGKDRTGYYSQIFDSNYMTQTEGWPGKVVDPETLKNWMPEEAGDHKGVLEPFIATFKADTLEELAGKLGIPQDTFVATVKRYNEMVAQGKDTDFGKAQKFLKPIEKAPFYGMHRHIRLSAICSGLVVDGNSQVLTGVEGQPIPGLFAIGNQAGGFYGAIDYPLDIFGLSLGRCYTAGYVCGKHVAKL